jgi:hypothetical protein
MPLPRSPHTRSIQIKGIIQQKTISAGSRVIFRNSRVQAALAFTNHFLKKVTFY